MKYRKFRLPVSSVGRHYRPAVGLDNEWADPGTGVQKALHRMPSAFREGEEEGMGRAGGGMAKGQERDVYGDKGQGLRG